MTNGQLYARAMMATQRIIDQVSPDLSMFVALFETRDQLLRRTTRLRRWLRRAGQLVRNCFRSKNARDAVAEGLRYYRSYPWHGRLLRVRNPVLVIGQPTRLSSPTQNPIPAPRRTVS